MTLEVREPQDQRLRERQISALWAIARNVRQSLVNRGLLMGLVLVALDSLAVARFQVESALAVIRYTPPLTLLVGVVLNLGPVLAPYVIVGMLVAVVAYGTDGTIDKAVAAAFGAAAAFYVSNAFLGGAYAWSPTKMAVWSVVVLVAAFGLSKAIDRGHADEALPYAVLVLGTATVLLSLAQDSALRQSIATPYLPPERIEVADRRGDPVVGYVLDVDQSGQWTTILVEDSRQVIVIRSRDVSSRAICTLRPDAERLPRWPIVPAADGRLELC